MRAKKLRAFLLLSRMLNMAVGLLSKVNAYPSGENAAI